MGNVYIVWDAKDCDLIKKNTMVVFTSVIDFVFERYPSDDGMLLEAQVVCSRHGFAIVDGNRLGF